MKTTTDRILLLVKVGVPLPRAVDMILGDGQYEALAPIVWKGYLEANASKLVADQQTR